MDGPRFLDIPTRISAGFEPFGACFRDLRNRRYLPTYIAGLLSDLPRKSGRGIALAAGVPPRTLERFMNMSQWDHGRLRDRLQQFVARDHGGPDSIALMVDQGVPKRRGWDPAAYRVRSQARSLPVRGLSVVNLGYSDGGRSGFLAGDLYMPEERRLVRVERDGSDGLPLCRPRWRIALELLDTARANGIGAGWLACDEAYFESAQFLEGLAERGQRFLGLLPSDHLCWILVPEGCDGRDDMTLPGFLALAKAQPLRAYCWTRSLRDQLEQHPALRFQPWRTCRVEGSAGVPRDWSVRRATCVAFGPKSWLGPLELVAYRPAGARVGARFAVTNDPSATGGVIVRAAERARQAAWDLDEAWTRLGMAHHTGRSYQGLKRHLILASIASWFLPSDPGQEDVDDSRIGAEPILVSDRAARTSRAGALRD